MKPAHGFSTNGWLAGCWPALTDSGELDGSVQLR